MNWRQIVSKVISICSVGVTTVIVLLSTSGAFGADISAPKTRIGVASDKFDGVTQVVVAFEISDWKFLRAHYIEFSTGSISSTRSNAAFASIGPVWRTPLMKDRFFADIGIAPTLISASRIGERDLGGRFHFTSFVSASMRIGRSSSISLRIQHTSNGGIRGANPGMDLLGLGFSFGFAE